MLQLPLERDLVDVTEADLELVATVVRRRLDQLADVATALPALRFAGQILPEAGSAVTVSDGGDGRPLLQLTYHSPTGFAWGYAGSGPSDLALSILHLVLVRAFHAAAFGPVTEAAPPRMAIVDGMALYDPHAALAQAIAWRFHHDYKFAVVAHLPDEPWSIEERNVLGFLLEQLVAWS